MKDKEGERDWDKCWISWAENVNTCIQNVGKKRGLNFYPLWKPPVKMGFFLIGKSLVYIQCLQIRIFIIYS